MFPLSIMNRILSIFFILIVLTGTLHFSVAAHYCGGKLADFSIAPGLTEASCGMEEGENSCSNNQTFNKACCSDQLFHNSTVGNFIFNPLKLVIFSPVALVNLLSLHINFPGNILAFVSSRCFESPPGEFFHSLPFLQIFRI